MWVVRMLCCAISIAATTTAAAEPQFVAEGYARRTIYHSPQTPGYTCWVGAWIMPDQSLMVTFKQATGPVDGRAQAPELMKKLGMDRYDPKRDYTGLSLANVYLRSTDGGTTWTTAAEAVFPGPLDRASWGGSHVALTDGSILRATDGSQLPMADVPRRIYFERSRDHGKTWGKPEIPPEPHRPVADVIGDVGDCISRVRRLRDGRLLATGVIRPDAKDRRVGLPLLMFSDDDAKTWHADRIDLTDDQRGREVWNEWDFAELPSGNLFCVFRRRDPKTPSKQVRFQGVFHKVGEAWRLQDYRPAAFEHSGHPELLVTREGPIVHFASNGVHWTADAGATWHALEIDGGKTSLRTRYYPRSIQTSDGRILVFSHAGGDNGYGDVDQSIEMARFVLRQK